MTAPLVILGCGFIGTHVARAALAQGRKVRACGRSTGKLAALGAAGAEIKFVDAGTPKHFTAAMSGMHGATVLYAIPPAGALSPGQAIRAALQAAYGVSAGCFIYLSSSGLYGAAPDDDTWIDEDSPLANDDAPMRNIQTDEQELQNSAFEMRTVILRLAPVYGGGKGLRGRIRAGQFRILDDGQHATSRIYIDDVVRVIAAAEERAPHKATLLVADDEPTTQGEYAKWLCDHLGLPLPPSRSMYEPGAPRVAHRNRKIRNARMKEVLGITLEYPSYRDGEAAIDRAES